MTSLSHICKQIRLLSHRFSRFGDVDGVKGKDIHHSSLPTPLIHNTQWLVVATLIPSTSGTFWVHCLFSTLSITHADTLSAGLLTNGLAAPISGLAITPRSFRARITEIHHSRIISIETTGSTGGREAQRARYAAKGRNSLFSLRSLVPWTTDHAHFLSDNKHHTYRTLRTMTPIYIPDKCSNSSTLLILPLYDTCCMCVGPLLVVGGLSLPTGSLTLPLPLVSLPPSSPLPGSTLLTTRYLSPVIFFQNHCGYMQKSKVSVDIHRKEKAVNHRAYIDQWIAAVTRFSFLFHDDRSATHAPRASSPPRWYGSQSAKLFTLHILAAFGSSYILIPGSA